ncbi:uncharacterized protein LOC104265712 [Ciona intestinalis]
MATLFLSLKIVDSDETLVRFTVLGQAVLGVVEKLIKHSDNSDCIQCAASMLELTIIPLEEALQNDGRESLTRLRNILLRIGTMKNHQLPKFHILIKLHLNRMLKKSLDGIITYSLPILTLLRGYASESQHLDEDAILETLQDLLTRKFD